MSSQTPSRSVPIQEATQELSVILDSRAFKQAPRLGTLLRYMCSKALLGDGQPVTEYTIAVDVFGKPPDFKESHDSSVRVEVHRLRKRLAHFYETEGAERHIRILIPPGRYTPQFELQEDNVHENTAPNEDLPPKQDAASPHSPPGPTSAAAASPFPTTEIDAPVAGRLNRRFTGFRVWLSVLILVLCAGATFELHRSYQSSPAKLSAIPPQILSKPAALAPPVLSAQATLPLRIIAGYQGPPHTDRAGAIWGSDRYFHNGHTWHQQSDPITARTNDPLLFQQWRCGEFSYDIPLAPGVYELHLYFVQSDAGPLAGRGESDDTFVIMMNGEPIMPGMDIVSDAMGPNISDERIFKDIHPGSDGMLHLAFTGAKGIPVINALELLPGLPHKQLPVRLVAQSTSYIDHLGQTWAPDNFYFNGQTVNRSLSTLGTPDPGLFTAERYGHFNYAIPVDQTGKYTVVLHFSESYFGPDQPGRGGVGSRVFNVMCNGVLLLENLDVFKEVGSRRALTKTFYHMKPTAQGKINLTFEPVANYAVISAIEVLDETR